MNAYEQLLKDFNLKVGEVFTYNGVGYIVAEDGIYEEYTNALADTLILDMLLGEIKQVKKWIPKMYENYYCPYLQSRNLYDHYIWYDNAYDEHRLEKGLVCKTKEEAQKLAKRMLEAIND